MPVASNTLPIQIIVNLWLHDGQRDLFNEFETLAKALMAKYSGTIISAITVQTSTRENPPDEIHLIEFPSMDAFDRYRQDEDLIDLSAMRAKCISATEIFVGALNKDLLD